MGSVGIALVATVGCSGADSVASSKPKGNQPSANVAAGCLNAGTPGATADCVARTRSPEYYVQQAELYFDTLDTDTYEGVEPNYSELVARWEWPPWLLLTGYGKDEMITIGKLLRGFDPSKVPERDCRAFDTQPFARCYVVFEYPEGRCPIYEEFVFDADGEMTFIETWSDVPGLAPTSPQDPWGQSRDFPRLSTRVPGLGNANSKIDLKSDWMLDAARTDPELDDFRHRASNWGPTWAKELSNAGHDLNAKGCGWSSTH